MAEAYLFGGVVTSWKTAGRDVLYVRPDAKFDKSKPISGGIPHCWPQFGPGAIQLHGFARNLDWELSAATGGAAPGIEMTLVDSDATRAMWPAKFKARRQSPPPAVAVPPSAPLARSPAGRSPRR